MARIFTQKLTPDELAVKIIRAAQNHDQYNVYQDWDGDPKTAIAYVYQNRHFVYLRDIIEQVRADLSKVNFDTENCEWSPEEAYMGTREIAGFRTLPNGLTYLGVIAGGDWECPVFHIIYWDGAKLRGYVPTDGNTWNTDTKEAYGNNEEADDKNSQKRFGFDADALDIMECDKIVADIEARIKFKTTGVVGPCKVRFKVSCSGEADVPSGVEAEMFVRTLLPGQVDSMQVEIQTCTCETVTGAHRPDCPMCPEEYRKGD